ncbi:Hpt domain-containing protein [Vibrio sp. TBV020]|uniref:Hpt domain-containing protein n=1 Tax=Vibrio sp. TBV020 TaxID=3137398 RepID=UPI0038CD778C
MLDFEALTAYLGDDHEIVHAVLSTYHEDHSNALEEIKELMQANNLDELHRLIHTLKGILTSFGEKTASAALNNVEIQLLQGDAINPDDMDVIFEEVAVINRQIEQALANN